ncbi:hypothetical protein BpHYR1_048532 [Brachionus plicatilis]|uniref:Uncharacterized protein n=1 Tax=Brachionus plicatilis TaxID=10195 RepID=A0A3M7QKM5_BRAPC|nr:hypothetical protein BpHYR1_048532 [Brachionus plicatilis]
MKKKINYHLFLFLKVFWALNDSIDSATPKDKITEYEIKKIKIEKNSYNKKNKLGLGKFVTIDLFVCKILLRKLILSQFINILILKSLSQRSVVTVIKTPKRARAKQPEVEIVNSDASIYSMTVPRKTNHHRPKIVLNDSTRVDSKELDKIIESASVYSSIRYQSFGQTSLTTSHLPPSYLDSVASFTIDKEQMKRNFTYL